VQRLCCGCSAGLVRVSIQCCDQLVLPLYARILAGLLRKVSRRSTVKFRDHQTERHSAKGFSCNISQNSHWCRMQQTAARCPTDRCFATHISTLWAGSCRSLQALATHLAGVEANIIQAAPNWAWRCAAASLLRAQLDRWLIGAGATWAARTCTARTWPQRILEARGWTARTCKTRT
jgi:hypothetical protein